MNDGKVSDALIAENERLRAEVAMLTHAVEQGHATIKLGHQLHDALANEMREAGVVVESDPIRVVNRRAERLRAKYQRAAESSEHFAARAERLAEALRILAANWDERCNTVLRQARDADESELYQYHITAGALAGCAHELRAALDQEGGNG